MTQFARGKPGTPRVSPAPVYDIVGWVTEREAAEIREKIDPPDQGKTQRTTISRWRSEGYVQGFSINGNLVLVNQENVISMWPLPQGKPSKDMDEKLPPIQDMLPDEITIRLVRRRGKAAPRRWKGEPK